MKLNLTIQRAEPVCVHCGEPFTERDDSHEGYKDHNVHVHRHCVVMVYHLFGYGKIDKLPSWVDVVKA